MLLLISHIVLQHVIGYVPKSSIFVNYWLWANTKTKITDNIHSNKDAHFVHERVCGGSVALFSGPTHLLLFIFLQLLPNTLKVNFGHFLGLVNVG